MKPSKKAITVLSFAVGTCIFITTAFADAMIGSGYDQLKSSLKHTAGQMEKGLDNYTVEMLYSLKDNGQNLMQVTTTGKIDVTAKATEDNTVTQYANGETMSNYSYSDRNRSVYKSGTDAQYVVYEYPDGSGRDMAFASPFNQQGAPEIEKIVDAVVGNLKDYVQAEERPDGGKSYTGSLSEAQVPAIVNAFSSFGMKQFISGEGRSVRNVKFPEIESDIFVKKVAGTAVENKNGVLESLTGDVVLSGKDKSGTQHDLALNVTMKLSHIGSTKITLPDLTGAHVEKAGSRMGGFSDKYVGTYKNNIIIEKNGQFVKIGERTLEILSVGTDKVTGRYSETVKPGYEVEYPDKYNFTFEYNPFQGKDDSAFSYTNAQGGKENGLLHPAGSGKLYLELNVEIMGQHSYRSNTRSNYDGEFVRVFGE